VLNLTIVATMTSSKATLRVGLIGCGGIFRLSHLPSYQALTHLASIVAVSDPHDPNRIEAGTSLGLDAGACFKDPGEMLREMKLDVCVIATPHHLHREQLLAVAHAGVACICEKPLVLENGDLLEVDAAFRASGKDCSVVHNYLYTSGSGGPEGRVAVLRADAGRLQQGVPRPRERLEVRPGRRRRSPERHLLS